MVDHPQAKRNRQRFGKRAKKENRNTNIHAVATFDSSMTEGEDERTIQKLYLSVRTEQRANGEVLQNRIEVLEAEMASVKQSLQKKQQRQE